MNKQMIARQFGKSLGTYDKEAVVQRYITGKMLRLVQKELRGSCSRIAEFGCGTGGYSRLLWEAFQPEHLFLNDLCEGAVSCLSAFPAERVSFLPGDAEQINFPKGLDLLTSCSALQWFQDPSRFFRTILPSLKENGLLAFSSFGTDNFSEIRQLTGRGLPYLSLSELTEKLSLYFEILHAEEEILPRYFSSPTGVLNHLKRTGVTASSGTPLSRGQLLQFHQQYTHLFGRNGQVCLTYHPLYIIAQKKKNIPCYLVNPSGGSSL